MPPKIADELKNSEILERVLSRDRFVLNQGIKPEVVRPGYGKASLVVTEHHLNGVDIVQGGALFTLADYAFALACNSYENVAVGIESNISFVKPSRVGDTLYAEAEEISRSKSLGSYLVRIVNAKGELIAVFYGRAFFRQEKK
ncbi:MAG: hotdog fold thioesterase [Planctomycetaceae bacterium]|jgi:acyl-CoA thioesterase|nr:hotdog fold thioesterase [Planctomycetaceae bacterium]